MLLLPLLLPLLPAAAAASYACSAISLDGKDYDLSAIKGTHAASKKWDTPPTTAEALVRFDVCGAVERDGKDEDQVSRSERQGDVKVELLGGCFGSWLWSWLWGLGVGWRGSLQTRRLVYLVAPSTLHISLLTPHPTRLSLHTLLSTNAHRSARREPKPA
jgi:hypothetical protein